MHLIQYNSVLNHLSVNAEQIKIQSLIFEKKIVIMKNFVIVLLVIVLTMQMFINVDSVSIRDGKNKN